jgi:hypothetical protein
MMRPHACACLQVLSTEKKAVLCSFSSQVLSGAQQTVGADAKKTLLVTFINENITFS